MLPSCYGPRASKPGPNSGGDIAWIDFASSDTLIEHQIDRLIKTLWKEEAFFLSHRSANRMDGNGWVGFDGLMDG
jgi:hypothetical protein